MAVLDGIVTVIGSATEVAVQPYTTFPWAMLLNGAMGGIGFYALRIILLTVCLKLILSPLDFFQRYKMRKNQLITMRLKPQMEKLEKAYGGNPRVLQQKQAELNKREGMSYLASCLPMIVTLVVFMWLWSALRTNAEYKQFSNYFLIYEKYDDAYVQSFGTYEEDGKEVSWYDENADRLSLSFGDKYTAAFDEAYVNAPAGEDAKETAYVSAYANAEVVADDEFGEAYFELFARSYADSFDDYVVTHTGSDTLREDAGEYAFLIASDKVAQSYCRIAAQTAAYDYFYSVGDYKDEGYSYDSFLWIRDIWSPDTPWSNSVAENKSDFVSRVGSYATDASRSGLSPELLEKAVGSYDVVMSRIISSGETGVNGYMVLPILAVALNIVSQIIMRKQQKKSGQDVQLGQNKGCMTAMVVIMPLLMAYFAFIYCAAFTLYMVLNSVMSLLINLVTSGISRRMIPVDTVITKDGGEFVERYGRPDPNKTDKTKK